MKCRRNGIEGLVKVGYYVKVVKVGYSRESRLLVRVGYSWRGLTNEM
jgi:hypothetical protein